MTEYGVHWNFFFTLGLLPIFGVFFERLATLIDLHWIALLLSGGEFVCTCSWIRTNEPS